MSVSRDLGMLLRSESSYGSTSCPQRVLVLGAGRDGIVETLLGAGVSERGLTLLDHGSDRARRLAWRFPEAAVLWASASQVAGIPGLDGTSFTTVVSSLPHRKLRAERVMPILDGITQHLGSGGLLLIDDDREGYRLVVDCLERIGCAGRMRCIPLGHASRSSDRARRRW